MSAIKSSGKFSRGYKGGRRSSDINSMPANRAYREACDRMGWDKMIKYCAGCGRLPSWCECDQTKQQEQNG